MCSLSTAACHLLTPGPLRAAAWLKKVEAFAKVRWDTAMLAAVQHQLNGARGCHLLKRITCLDEWFLNSKKNKEKVGGARTHSLLTIPMNSPGFDLHFRAQPRVEEEESPGEEREQTAGRSRDNGGERTMTD